MDAPELVQERVGDEEIAASVHLGGDDAVFVTPTRTLVYRAEGLLSDESVEAFPHSVERLSHKESRRKTTFTLEYVDETREFTVPRNRAEDVLKPVLAGVLAAGNVIDPGEAVAEVYRFSELTLAVTSARVLKHIGGAVWDGDYEEYAYEDVTGLEFEEGDVATQIVIRVDGRPQRIKTPNERAGVVRRTLERALFDYHDVDSRQEFEAAVAPEEDEEEEAAEATAEAADEDEGFGEGIEPLVTDERAGGTTGDAEAETGEAAGGESATGFEFDATDEEAAEATGEEAETADGDVAERLAALTEAVERQTQLIERQQATIEQLIDELQRGR